MSEYDRLLDANNFTVLANFVPNKQELHLQWFDYSHDKDFCARNKTTMLPGIRHSGFLMDRDDRGAAVIEHIINNGDIEYNHGKILRNLSSPAENYINSKEKKYLFPYDGGLVMLHERVVKAEISASTSYVYKYLGNVSWNNLTPDRIHVHLLINIGDTTVESYPDEWSLTDFNRLKCVETKPLHELAERSWTMDELAKRLTRLISQEMARLPNGAKWLFYENRIDAGVPEYVTKHIEIASRKIKERESVCRVFEWMLKKIEEIIASGETIDPNVFFDLLTRDPSTVDLYKLKRVAAISGWTIPKELL